MIKKTQLDQFYTNPLVSDELVKIIKEKLPKQFSQNFLEPSAGTGNFIKSLIKMGVSRKKIIAYDIEPKAKGIIHQDYLKKKSKMSKKRMIVGNPPFGKRGKKALEFLNKSLQEAPYVAMILPNIFNRYSIQKQILNQAKLIYKKQLKENSFILNDSEYKVKCVFQIWTTELVHKKNLRILEKPQIRHKDLKTWIHNNTKNTLKYFDKEKYQWDLAVHRQGYYNYNEKIINPKKLIKNRQYFFIKANNNKILNIIKKIDFKKLSYTNTQVYGFSTSDFIKEYKKIKEKNNVRKNI